MKPSTQIEAWNSIQEKLPTARRQVMDVIFNAGDFGISLVGISESLEWPINCVSGRVTELKNLGLIKDSGRRWVNASGRKSIIWVQA